MIDSNQIIIIFTIFSLISFAYIFWRDSIKEGYSSDKILDAFVLISLSSIIGGKILFRKIDIDYFRYELINSPLILEGVLVGGAIATFILIRKNKWSGWKIGDMIAPALSFFQAILFLGFYFATKLYINLIIFISFSFLYLLIRYLKVKKKVGTSSNYFFRKRMKKFIFSGILIVTYLTVSSMIAILFLLVSANRVSWFWWFQLFFYFFILVLSIILFYRQYRSNKSYED